MFRKTIRWMFATAVLAVMFLVSAVPAMAADKYYLPVKVEYRYGKKGELSTAKFLYDANANFKGTGNLLKCYYKKNRLFKSKWASFHYVYTYDKKGRINRRYQSSYEMFDSGEYNKNGYYEQYSYDAEGKVSKKTVYVKYKKYETKYFTYRKNGSLKKITIKNKKGKTEAEVGVNSKGHVTYIKNRNGSDRYAFAKKTVFKYSYGKKNSIRIMMVFDDGKLSYNCKYTYKWIKAKKKHAVVPFEINPFTGPEWLCELFLA